MAKKKPKPQLRSELHHGDCVTLLPEKVGSKQANLAVCDPPYNLGQAYANYNDNKPLGDYLAWTEEWVAAVRQALHPHGSMFVFINDHLVSELDVLIKRMGFHKRSQIVWYYTFGQNTSGNFTPSHTQILYYTKAKTKYTWRKDDPSLRVPSQRQLVYQDKRANPLGRLPDNTWILHPSQMKAGAFDPAGDTWLASRVAGTFKEREAHSPNQLPLPIVERIIRFTSRDGDLIIDPFLGAGGTGVVCKQTGRNFVGFDVSKTCVKNSRKRIDDAQVP